ncbi:MAG: hypothetical protein PHU63_04425 [Candidatus ainarchaeum sp.]|nr:hypothetical protein [Candidatus ainarchaeum sp.]
MSEVDKVTDKTVEQGGVLALLYFDLQGGNKELLQQLGVGFIKKLLTEQGVVYARGQIDEPIMENNTIYTSIEVKILTKSFSDLMRLCGNYSPFSVEVLKPNNIKLSLDQMHDILMNISATTHEYKKYILEKVTTGEDLKKYQESIQNKVKLGKLLMEKKKK